VFGNLEFGKKRSTINLVHFSGFDIMHQEKSGNPGWLGVIVRAIYDMNGTGV
jgi:hypothetical protein